MLDYKILVADTYGLTDFLTEHEIPFEYADGNNGYDVDELIITIPFEPTPANVFNFSLLFSRWFFTGLGAETQLND